MPNKRLKKRGKMEASEGTASADNDAMSTRSALAGSQSHMSEDSCERLADFDDDAANAASGEDTSSAQDIFEDKLKDAIEGMAEKSAKGRLNSVRSLMIALRKKVLTSFLQERHVTVADSLERCLKKGKGEERVCAAKAISLLCINLGLTDEGESVFAGVKSTLIQILQDPSASPLSQSACAETLGLCGFIAANDLEVRSDLMTILESVFTRSYLKGDKSAPSFSPQSYALHVSALESWCLLLSISTPAAIKIFLDRQLHRLPELLESVDLEVRIAGGEALALLYELAREQDENFEGPQLSSLCERLKQLSTDNNKHQTKKGRKQQRSSFRDILHFIEEGSFRDVESKFGREAVYIDSWTRKRQYDSLCSQLESGTNTHLQENMLLREIFDLGSPIPDGTPTQKQSKNDRRLYNQAAFKARTQVRKKLRDKRVAQLSG